MHGAGDFYQISSKICRKSLAAALEDIYEYLLFLRSRKALAIVDSTLRMKKFRMAWCANGGSIKNNILRARTEYARHWNWLLQANFRARNFL